MLSVNKWECVYPIKWYLALKKNEKLIWATTLKNFTGVLSERSKTISCKIPLI